MRDLTKLWEKIPNILDALTHFPIKDSFPGM